MQCRRTWCSRSQSKANPPTGSRPDQRAPFAHLPEAGDAPWISDTRRRRASRPDRAEDQRSLAGCHPRDVHPSPEAQLVDAPIARSSSPSPFAPKTQLGRTVGLQGDHHPPARSEASPVRCRTHLRQCRAERVAGHVRSADVRRPLHGSRERTTPAHRTGARLQRSAARPARPAREGRRLPTRSAGQGRNCGPDPQGKCSPQLATNPASAAAPADGSVGKAA